MSDLDLFFTPEQQEKRLSGLHCPICGSDTRYIVDGEYECISCGQILYDDFGIVRKYIMDNGVSTVYEIVKNTGVSARSVLNLLRYGKLQMRESSGMYMKCEICGTDLINGMVCPACHENIDRNSKKHADRLHLYNMGDVPQRRKNTAEKKGTFMINPNIDSNDYKDMERLKQQKQNSSSRLVKDLYEKKSKEVKAKTELRWHFNTKYAT